MKQNLTIEQLKKAREIGATHYFKDAYVKSGINGGAAFLINEKWEVHAYYTDPNGNDNGGWVNEKIDFSPLNEPERMTGGYRDLGKSDTVAMKDKYPKYYKDVAGLNEIDVYQVHNLFDIQDASGCLQHASKKLLLSGVRTGGKSKLDDIREARDTLTRWLDINSSE